MVRKPVDIDFETEFAKLMQTPAKPRYRDWPYVLGYVALGLAAFWAAFGPTKIVELTLPHL